MAAFIQPVRGRLLFFTLAVVLSQVNAQSPGQPCSPPDYTGEKVTKWHRLDSGQSRCCVDIKCFKGTQAVVCNAGDPASTFCQECEGDTFQSHQTYSADMYKCEPRRSCPEKHALVKVDNGTIFSDAVCQCDLTKGYVAPLGEKNPKHCIGPKVCPAGKQLSTSGECESCKWGTFKPDEGLEQCKDWTTCEGQKVKVAQLGTDTTDSVCDADDSSAMPGWLVGLIVIVVVGMMVIIVVIILYRCKRRRRRLPGSSNRPNGIGTSASPPASTNSPDVQQNGHRNQTRPPSARTTLRSNSHQNGDACAEAEPLFNGTVNNVNNGTVNNVNNGTVNNGTGNNSIMNNGTIENGTVHHRTSDEQVSMLPLMTGAVGGEQSMGVQEQNINNEQFQGEHPSLLHQDPISATMPLDVERASRGQPQHRHDLPSPGYAINFSPTYIANATVTMNPTTTNIESITNSQIGNRNQISSQTNLKQAEGERGFDLDETSNETDSRSAMDTGNNSSTYSVRSCETPEPIVPR